MPQGEGHQGERPQGEGHPGDGHQVELLPPSDSPSSCCSTLTSELCPAPTAPHRVGAVGRGSGAITSP